MSDSTATACRSCCASVAREDIIALFVERLEAEILAFPEHVSVEAVEDVSHEPPPDRHDRLPPAMMRPWGLVAGDAVVPGSGGDLACGSRARNPSRGHEHPSMSRPEEQAVTVRPRTILLVLGISILVGLALMLVYLAWHVVTWILIAILLAAALNPAVEAIERRGRSRPMAATVVFAIALMVVTGLGLLVIPPLVSQATDFVDAVPKYIDDLTAGRGPLGFLQEHYKIVDRIRDTIEKRGAAGVLGLSGPVIGVVQSIVGAVAGVITIIFLTYFMLLEGPRTVAGVFGLIPEPARGRCERVGQDIYRTISGYVTGNLLISLIAGTFAAVLLFAVGSSYAIALGLVVAVLDLIPLAGATLGTIIVAIVVFIELDWIRSAVVVGLLIAYQQVENNLLQPLVYRRMVQLSPLAILCAVLVGAELAGILGALIAIPVAGSLLAVAREALSYRREVPGEEPLAEAPESSSA
jgi:predicted PurR-regulated permease PerM